MKNGWKKESKKRNNHPINKNTLCLGIEQKKIIHQKDVRKDPTKYTDNIT